MNKRESTILDSCEHSSRLETKNVAILCAGARLPQGCLRLTAENVERSPKFMGDVGRKAREAGERLVQAPEHGIEVICQTCEFGRQMRQMNTLAQRNALESAGHLHGLGQRPRRSPGW